MNQAKRKAIAEDTLQILEKGFYTNRRGEKVDLALIQKKAEENTRLFRPQELDELLDRLKKDNSFETKYEVTNETTLDAARRLAAEGVQHIMCLNFASAKNPGGGFLGGALAQEECIARASGLYPTLLQAAAYYEYHRMHRSGLYSDHMIYSPGVPIIKDEGGLELDEPVCISIVTAPAVNAGVIKRDDGGSTDKIIPAMKARIEKLLALCMHYRHTTLILGAWGCGVFRNDPDMIAGLFHEALTGPFANQFDRVLFAVKTNKEEIIEPFAKRFRN
ncbi:TIGR02452 family protein [Longitalea arenae]|uniref:TIGR02452 family protein n=1 Tax=Longitalea arenae TaxID=2812558 RepID=UPI0019678F28|nr:TIGR02452 family protein [Longitalea arenae]